MAGTSSSGGRNRKSQREHALAGTGRTDRGTKPKGKTTDPDPPRGRPPTPKGLVGMAREEWARMVNRLEAAKILSVVDDAALYQYCCLYAETEGIRASRMTNARLLAKLEAALERVRHEDQIAAVASAIGDLQRVDAKHLQQLRQGHMAIRQYLVEFGMTPAARSRVRATDAPAPEDPFAEFDSPAATDSTH
jgi:P27 family predicted phage terminase small subunit